MTKKERAGAIVARLKEKYPNAVNALEHDKPWQLLFSARLAAQCTDVRVSIVSGPLYEKYPTLEAFAGADVADLEAMIYSTGFFRAKARNLKAAAEMLLTRFNGSVPDTMEDLLTLPGVGRKISNLILGDIYGKPAVVADTHCIRLSNRFGLCDSTDPKKVEFTLKKIIVPEEQSGFCHRLVFFGREICTARSPRCGVCVVSGLCEYQKNHCVK
jgi:endonuclease-3